MFQLSILAKDTTDVIEMFEKGLSYENKEDYSEAYEWYLKAAEQGDAKAQYIIGRMYYHGKGVNKDFLKAFKWFLKTAEQRSAGALTLIGAMFSFVNKDREKALERLHKAAASGNPLAKQFLQENFK